MKTLRRRSSLRLAERCGLRVLVGVALLMLIAGLSLHARTGAKCVARELALDAVRGRVLDLRVRIPGH